MLKLYRYLTFFVTLLTALHVSALEKSDNEEQGDFNKVSPNICNLTLTPEKATICNKESVTFTAEVQPCTVKAWSYKLFSDETVLSEENEDGDKNYIFEELIKTEHKLEVKVTFLIPGDFEFEVTADTNDPKVADKIKKRKSTVTVIDPKTKLTVAPLLLKLQLNQTGTVKATIDKNICPKAKVTVEFNKNELKVETPKKALNSGDEITDTTDIDVTPLQDGKKTFELVFKVDGEVCEIVKIEVPFIGCVPIWVQPSFSANLLPMAFCKDEVPAPFDVKILSGSEDVVDGGKITIFASNCSLNQRIYVNSLKVTWLLVPAGDPIPGSNEITKPLPVDLSGYQAGEYKLYVSADIGLQYPGVDTQKTFNVSVEIYDGFTVEGPEKICYAGEGQPAGLTKYILKVCQEDDETSTFSIKADEHGKLYVLKDGKAEEIVKSISVEGKEFEFYVKPLKQGNLKLSVDNLNVAKDLKQFYIAIEKPDFKSVEISPESGDWKDKRFSVDANDPDPKTVEIAIQSLDSSMAVNIKNWYHKKFTKEELVKSKIDLTNVDSVIFKSLGTASSDLNFTLNYQVNEEAYYLVMAEVECGDESIYYMHQVIIKDVIKTVKVVPFEWSKSDYWKTPPDKFCDGQLVKALALDDQNKPVNEKIDWSGILDDKRLQTAWKSTFDANGKPVSHNSDINKSVVYFYIAMDTDDGKYVNGTFSGDSSANTKSSQIINVEKSPIQIEATVKNGSNKKISQGTAIFKGDNVNIEFEVKKKTEEVKYLNWQNVNLFETEKIKFEVKEYTFGSDKYGYWSQNKDMGVGECYVYYYYKLNDCTIRAEFKFYQAEITGLLFSSGGGQKKEANSHKSKIKTLNGQVLQKILNNQKLILEPKFNPSEVDPKKIFEKYKVSWDLDFAKEINSDGDINWDDLSSFSNNFVISPKINLKQNLDIDLYVNLSVDWVGYDYDSHHHFDAVSSKCEPLTVLKVGSIDIPLPKGGIAADPEASTGNICVYKFTAPYNLNSPNTGIKGSMLADFIIKKNHETGKITGGTVTLTPDASSGDNKYTIAKHFEFKASKLSIDITGEGEKNQALVANAAAEIDVALKTITKTDIAGTPLKDFEMSDLGGSISFIMNNDGFTTDFSDFDNGKGSVNIGSFNIKLAITDGLITFTGSSTKNLVAPAPLRNLTLHGTTTSGEIAIESEKIPKLQKFTFKTGLSARMSVSDQSILISGNLEIDKNLIGDVQLNMNKPVDLTFSPFKFEFQNASAHLDFDLKKGKITIGDEGVGANAVVDLFNEQDVINFSVSYKNYDATFTVTQQKKFSKTIGPLRALTIEGINGSLTFGRGDSLTFAKFNKEQQAPVKGSFSLLGSEFTLTFTGKNLKIENETVAESEFNLFKPLKKVTANNTSVNLNFDFSSTGLLFKKCEIKSSLETSFKFDKADIAVEAEIDFTGENAVSGDALTVDLSGSGAASLENDIPIKMKGVDITVQKGLTANAVFNLSSVDQKNLLELDSLYGEAKLSLFDQDDVVTLDFGYQNRKIILTVTTDQGIENATVLKAFKNVDLQGFGGTVEYDFDNGFDVTNFQMGSGSADIGPFNLNFTSDKNKIKITANADKDIIINKKIIPFEQNSIVISKPVISGEIQIFDALKVNSFLVKSAFAGDIKFKKSTLAIKGDINIPDFTQLESEVSVNLEDKGITLGLDRFSLEIPPQNNIARVGISFGGEKPFIDLKSVDFYGDATLFKVKEQLQMQFSYSKQIFTFKVHQNKPFNQPADLNLGPVKNLQISGLTGASFTYDANNTKFTYTGFNKGAGSFDIANQNIIIQVKEGKIKASHTFNDDIELGNLGPVRDMVLKNIKTGVVIGLTSEENRKVNDGGSKFNFEKFTFSGSASAKVRLKEKDIVDVNGSIKIDSISDVTFTADATLAKDLEIPLGRAALILHGTDTTSAGNTPFKVEFKGDLNKPSLAEMFIFTKFEGSADGFLYGSNKNELAQARLTIQNSTFTGTFKAGGKASFNIKGFNINSAEVGGKVSGDFATADVSLDSAYVKVDAVFKNQTNFISGKLKAKIDYDKNGGVEGTVLNSGFTIQPREHDNETYINASVQSGSIKLDKNFEFASVSITNGTVSLQASKVAANINIQSLVFANGELQSLVTTGNASVEIKKFLFQLSNIQYTNSSKTFKCNVLLKVGKKTNDKKGEEDNMISGGITISPEGLSVDDIIFKIKYRMVEAEGNVKFKSTSEESYFQSSVKLSLSQTLARSPIKGASVEVKLGQKGSGIDSFRYAYLGGAVEGELPLFQTGLSLKEVNAGVGYHADVVEKTALKDNYGIRLGAKVGLVGTDIFKLGGGLAVNYSLTSNLSASVLGDITLDLTPFAKVEGKATATYTFGEGKFTLKSTAEAKFPAASGDLLSLKGNFDLETYYESSTTSTASSATSPTSTTTTADKGKGYWKATAELDGTLFGGKGKVFGKGSCDSKTGKFDLNGAVFLSATKKMKTGDDYDVRKEVEGWIFDRGYKLRWGYSACFLASGLMKNDVENKKFNFDIQSGALFKGQVEYAAYAGIFEIGNKVGVTITLNGTPLVKNTYAKKAYEEMDGACKRAIDSNGTAKLNANINYGQSKSASVSVNGGATISLSVKGDGLSFSYNLNDSLEVSF